MSQTSLIANALGSCLLNSICDRDAGGGVGVGAGGHMSPQVLGHQCTLFGPRGGGGGQVLPASLLVPPRVNKGELVEMAFFFG